MNQSSFRETAGEVLVCLLLGAATEFGGRFASHILDRVQAGQKRKKRRKPRAKS